MTDLVIALSDYPTMKIRRLVQGHIYCPRHGTVEVGLRRQQLLVAAARLAGRLFETHARGVIVDERALVR